MHTLRILTVVLSLTTLVACSTKQDSTSEIPTSKPNNVDWQEVKTANTILNLTPEKQGLALQTLQNAGKTFVTSGAHDAVLVNAQHALTEDAKAALNAALKSHQPIIVDSDGSASGTQRVSDVVLEYGGMGLAADSVIIQPRGEGAASVTPFDQSPAVSKQGTEEQPTSNDIKQISSLL